MKKMMYYNMRVRSAQRNLAETRLSLTEKEKTMLQLPEECIRTLHHTLKNVCAIFGTFKKICLAAVTREPVKLFGCNLQLQVAFTAHC